MKEKFDWKFYISNYSDLRNCGIDTEQKAYNHYIKYGKFENRRTHSVVNENENNLKPLDLLPIISSIKQIHVSNALKSFSIRIKNKYNLIDYYDLNIPSLFFGAYTDEDIKLLNYHKNIKYLIWGGEDANYSLDHSLNSINEIKNIHNIIHISISKCIYQRLKHMNINSILVDFNLVDYNIFKPIYNKGKNILIFNGQTPNREHIYGKEYYQQIVPKLSSFNYLYSNKLNVKHEDMYKIYSTCFIMLRLTKYDGNANSVQECKAMNIPVVHNQSDYGLKWTSVEDIIHHILTFSS